VLGALLLRWVDMVVFSSEIERRDSPIASAGAAAVLPHPVVDERSEPPPVPRPREGLSVGFLGRLHAKKNLPALLEAVAKCPGVELVVAGSGPEEHDHRQRAAALGLDSRLQWLGFVDAEGKRKFFERIDVLAMPSLYECFGISAVEAMQAARPVIVSDTVGIAPAVADHEAGVVTGRDPESIAAAIGRLRDSPELRERFSRGATQAAREEFSFASFGRAVAGLYSQVA
jgi:glycosyltransferase involved in cell wall biosynthesis